MRHKIAFIVAVLLVSITASAQAQTGPCPNDNTLTIVPAGGVINACLSPSLDPTGGHNAVDAASRPVVVRYDMLIFNDGDPVTGTPVATINIGKPSLNAQNAGWTTISPAGIPTNRRLRTAVVAVGQVDTETGQPVVSGRSPLSPNPFILAPSAVVPVAPGSLVVP
jgi:hypothetical protein